MLKTNGKNNNSLNSKRGCPLAHALLCHVSICSFRSLSFRPSFQCFFLRTFASLLSYNILFILFCMNFLLNFLDCYSYFHCSFVRNCRFLTETYSILLFFCYYSSGSWKSSRMTIQLCSSEHLFVSGSTVEVTTLHKEVIVGEVFAFDYDSRLLILKVKSSTSSSKSPPITILNLSLCSEIKPLSTPAPETTTGESPSSKLFDIDFRKLENRLDRAVEERNALVRNFSSGGCTGGVLLYYQLAKNFSNEHVKWSGDQIIVKGNVAIKSPYKTGDVGPAPGVKDKAPESSVQYIRSIVEKFWVENKDTENGKVEKKKTMKT